MSRLLHHKNVKNKIQRYNLNFKNTFKGLYKMYLQLPGCPARDRPWKKNKCAKTYPNTLNFNLRIIKAIGLQKNEFYD